MITMLQFVLIMIIIVIDYDYNDYNRYQLHVYMIQCAIGIWVAEHYCQQLLIIKVYKLSEYAWAFLIKKLTVTGST